MNTITREDRAKWLKLARIRAGYRSCNKAAAAIGLAQKTYHNFETGRSDPLRRLDHFAAAFGVTKNTLLTGILPNGEALQEEEKPHTEDSTIAPKMPEDSNARELFSAFGCSENVLIVKNPDRAMTAPGEAKILPLDILAFEPSLAARPGDYVLAKIAGQAEPLFRIYSPLRGNRIALNAINPAVKPITLARSHLTILGRLCFFARGAETLG
jgi:DNA-binding XRE family transcriptional regulator